MQKLILNWNSLYLLRIRELKISYKRTVKNDEGRRPVIPNVVSAYYRGSYYTGEVFDQNFTGKDPGDFDSPTEFWVNPISMI